MRDPITPMQTPFNQALQRTRLRRAAERPNR